jgi:hypothetical protein
VLVFASTSGEAHTDLNVGQFSGTTTRLALLLVAGHHVLHAPQIERLLWYRNKTSVHE